MMELSELNQPSPWNNSTFTKDQIKKKHRDLRNYIPNRAPTTKDVKENMTLPVGIGLILLFILSIFLYYIKQRTLWGIYQSYENPPKLLDTFIIGLMVLCWPFYYLKFYIL